MMRSSWMLLIPCLAVSGLLAADGLVQRWQNRLHTIDSTYKTAIAKAENSRFVAVQKANGERLKMLKTTLSEATRAGDFAAGTILKELVEYAEKETGIPPKPTDLLKFDKHKYAIVNDKVSFYVAKRNCELWQGHLVTFESEEEEAFVLEACRKAKIGAWIGATSESNFPKWSWIDGHPLKLKHNFQIDNSQPDHFSRAIVFWPSTDNWNDHEYGARIGYVCEWDD